MTFTNDHKEFLAEVIDRADAILAESEEEQYIDTGDLLELATDFRFIANKVLAEISKG